VSIEVSWRVPRAFSGLLLTELAAVRQADAIMLAASGKNNIAHKRRVCEAVGGRGGYRREEGGRGGRMGVMRYGVVCGRV